MAQMLLFPDPRPLVERLGPDFFRKAPPRPGVYLMMDPAGLVLYVGKAKDLRRRLASYRVANPDRLPRRHLRLLRAVDRIELRECADEPAALALEAELLRSLRPRFNRAGTWPSPPRRLAWRIGDQGVDLTVLTEHSPEWHGFGPLAGAFHLRAILLRLLWCAWHPHRGLSGMPEGWFHGRYGTVASVPCAGVAPREVAELPALLEGYFSGRSAQFIDWLRARVAETTPTFETALREEDLESLADFAERLATGKNMGTLGTASLPTR